MNKKAQAAIIRALTSPLGQRLVGGTLGGATGGALGYGVTPHVFGYEDVDKARRISAYGDAIVGAIAGAALGPAAQRANLIGKFKRLGLKNQLGIGGSLAAVPVIAEAPPILAASQIKQREAAEKMQQAAQDVSQAATSVSIPAAVQKMLSSGTTQGATAGAAAAGLASLISGLMRSKTKKEVIEDSSRGDMVRKDFLRYLLPALVAGGVIGSFRNQKPNQPV